MTTNNFFSLRNIAMLAMGLMAILFASASSAHAQDQVNPTKVNAIINGLTDECFPMDVVYNYEGTDATIDYRSNGDFSDEAPQGVGQLRSAMVWGVPVQVGGEGVDVERAGLRIHIKLSFNIYTGEIALEVDIHK